MHPLCIRVSLILYTFLFRASAYIYLCRTRGLAGPPSSAGDACRAWVINRLSAVRALAALCRVCRIWWQELVFVSIKIPRYLATGFVSNDHVSDSKSQDCWNPFLGQDYGFNLVQSQRQSNC